MVWHDLPTFGPQGAVTSEGFHSLCGALEELVIEGLKVVLKSVFFGTAI